MPWFRLDDSFHSHPKVIAAGNEAVGLYVRCGSYCAQHLTDGFIPEHVLLLYGSRPLADALVAAKLLQRAKGGWRMRDYLDYNPSRDEVLELRRKRADAGKKGGLNSGKTRSKTEANAEALASRLLEPPSRPVPGFTADAVNRSNGSNQARASPETIDAVISEIYDTTSRVVDHAWAERVAADILQGRSVASPAAYVRSAIRQEPRRFTPTSQPPPVAEVLPKPGGRHARKDTST